MASNGNSRGKSLAAGGILSIVVGIFQINNGAMLVAYFFGTGLQYTPAWQILPFLPGLWFHFWQIPIPAIVGWRPSFEYVATGVPLLILGIVAIAGGISAVRRKSFGLSLVGAVYALASGLLGVLAVVFF